MDYGSPWNKNRVLGRDVFPHPNKTELSGAAWFWDRNHSVLCVAWLPREDCLHVKMLRAQIADKALLGSWWTIPLRFGKAEACRHLQRVPGACPAVRQLPLFFWGGSCNCQGDYWPHSAQGPRGLIWSVASKDSSWKPFAVQEYSGNCVKREICLMIASSSN